MIHKYRTLTYKISLLKNMPKYQIHKPVLLNKLNGSGEGGSLPPPPGTIYGTRKLITVFTKEPNVPIHRHMNQIGPSHPFLTSISMLSFQPKYIQ